MVLENYEPEIERKWSIGPDIIEECQAADSMPVRDPDEWEPAFDSYAFND